MKKNRIYSFLITCIMAMNILPVINISAMVQEDTLQTLAIFFEGEFPKGSWTDTSSSWHARITADGESYKGTNSMKIVIDELYDGFWPFFDVNFESSISAANRNAQVLSLDIKMPQDRSPNMYIYLKTVDKEGRSVNPTLNLADFVSNEQLGVWTNVVIPLSDFSEYGEWWDESAGMNRQILANYNNITGYGFKCDANAMGKGYQLLINNYKLLYREDIGIDLSKKPDGSYYTIYDDLCVSDGLSYWGGVTDFRVIDSQEEDHEGDHALLAVFDNTASWPGGYLAFEDAVNLKTDKSKMALKFRILTSEKAELKIGLMGRELDQEYKVEVPVYEYIIDQSTNVQEVVIPLTGFGDTGIQYDSAGNTIKGIFPWQCVTKLTFALNTQGIKNMYYVYIDDIQIVETNDYIAETPAKPLPEEQYTTAIANQHFTTVDLAPYSTTDYDSWAKLSDIYHDFKAYKPSGADTFIGIPFQMDSQTAVMLKGMARNDLPDSVRIPLNQEAKGIYFLHTAVGQTAAVAYQFNVRYTDETAIRQTVTTNKDISDWTRTFATDSGRTVHTFTNDAGNTVGMGVYAWGNPYPEKTIASIEFITKGTDGCAVVLGMTLTDTLPVMIETQKNPEANPDMSCWYEYEQPNPDKIMGTALDMSKFLDAPAGKYGYVKTDGDAFVFENSGSKAVFHGVNLSAEANFQTKEQADAIINRIVSQGYNIVRFHHMDSDWVNPNIFGEDANQTLTLDPVSLDLFEYLWAGLKEKGVYLYVDGVVGRRFREGELGSVPVTAISAGAKVTGYFVDIIEQRQMEYLNQLFTHVNPYTGTTLAEDPAVVMLDLHNEDSLLWKPALKWNLYNDAIRKDISSKFNAWLLEKYQNTDALRAAWTETGKKGLESSENLENNTIYLRYNYLTWGYSIARVKDTREFLLELQNTHYRKIYDYCRNSVGIKCMITGSNAPESLNALDLYSNAIFGGEFVDQHYYMSSPINEEWSYTWGISSDSAFETMMDNGQNNMIQYFGERTVYGKPFVVSEWNQCEPNQYLGAGMLMFPAYSAMHGWSQIQFNFLQGNVPGGDGLYDLLSSYNHPVKTAMSYATAGMLARNDITETEAGFYTKVDYSSALDPDYEPVVQKGLTLIGKSGIYFEDIQIPENNEEVLNQAQAAQETGVYVSYEKDMRTDVNKRMFELNTAGTQAYAGFADGRVILEDVDFTIENDYAAVVLTSLDRTAGIRSAENLLLIATARCRNTDATLSPEGTYMTSGGVGPVLVEPVQGIVNLKTKDQYKVYALTSSGERVQELPVTVLQNGSKQFYIGAKYQTMYYELVKTEDVADDQVFGERPEWSRNFNVTEPVSNLKISDAARDSVIVSWDVQRDADGYNIYRDGKKITNTPVQKAVYEDLGLFANTEYVYTVTAVKNGVESEQSLPVTITTPGIGGYDYWLFCHGMTQWNDHWYIQTSQYNSSVLQTDAVLSPFGGEIFPWAINLNSNGYVKHYFNNAIDLSDVQKRADTALCFDVKVYDMNKENGDPTTIELGDRNNVAVSITLPGFITTQTITRPQDARDGWIHYEIPLDDFQLNDAEKTIDWAQICSVSLATGSWQGVVMFIDNIRFTSMKPELIALRYYDAQGDVMPSDNGKAPTGAKTVKLRYNKELTATSVTNIKLICDGVLIDCTPIFDGERMELQIELPDLATVSQCSILIGSDVITLPAVGAMGSESMVDASVDSGSKASPLELLLKGEAGVFFDETGQPITKIIRPTAVRARFTLETDAYVAIAVYEGNVLKYIQGNTMSAGVCETEPVSVSPEQTVKVFILDSIERIKPLAAPYKL